MWTLVATLALAAPPAAHAATPVAEAAAGAARAVARLPIIEDDYARARAEARARAVPLFVEVWAPW